jgi:ABC-2 type transport system permease protein
MGGGGALVPTFLSAMLKITILMILAYVVQAAAKTRAEENAGHLENLLATRLSRVKWLALHLGVVLLGAAVMMALSGLVMALTVNAGSEWTVDVGEYVWGALSYVPLAVLVIGVYAALFGLLPRAASLVTWTFYGFIAFMAWVGQLLQLPQWVMNLSPMTHLAAAPAEAVKTEPMLAISAIAVGLLAIGFAAWRRRNSFSN